MITIRCDTRGCGVRSTGPASTISAAQARWGWAHQDGKDICPSCLDGDTPQDRIAELEAERDALAEQIADLLKRTERWQRQAQEHGEDFEQGVGGKYEYGKAVVYDALATEVRGLLDGYHRARQTARGELL